MKGGLSGTVGVKETALNKWGALRLTVSGGWGLPLTG